MRCCRGFGRNHVPIANPLGARVTIAIVAIRMLLFMHGIICIGRGSCSKVGACIRAAKSQRRVARWLCCMAAMFVRQMAWAQQYPYPAAALPQASQPIVGSRSLIEYYYGNSSGL